MDTIEGRTPSPQLTGGAVIRQGPVYVWSTGQGTPGTPALVGVAEIPQRPVPQRIVRRLLLCSTRLLKLVVRGGCHAGERSCVHMTLKRSYRTECQEGCRAHERRNLHRVGTVGSNLSSRCIPVDGRVKLGEGGSSQCCTWFPQRQEAIQLQLFFGV